MKGSGSAEPGLKSLQPLAVLGETHHPLACRQRRTAGDETAALVRELARGEASRYLSCEREEMEHRRMVAHKKRSIFVHRHERGRIDRRVHGRGAAVLVAVPRRVDGH